MHECIIKDKIEDMERRLRNCELSNSILTENVKQIHGDIVDIKNYMRWIFLSIVGTVISGLVAGVMLAAWLGIKVLLGGA